MVVADDEKPIAREYECRSTERTAVSGMTPSAEVLRWSAATSAAEIARE